MYQYYIVELQQYQDGSYGNLVHFEYDVDENTAQLKGESKYHQVQSAAAVSDIPGHGAILLSSKGNPVGFQYYNKREPDSQSVEQYYVVELQKYMNGEFGHLVHIAYDADGKKARRKGDSKFYEILSAAAVSEIAEHAAVLIASDATPLDTKCYINED